MATMLNQLCQGSETSATLPGLSQCLMLWILSSNDSSALTRPEGTRVWHLWLCLINSLISSFGEQKDKKSRKVVEKRTKTNMEKGNMERTHENNMMDKSDDSQFHVFHLGHVRKSRICRSWIGRHMTLVHRWAWAIGDVDWLFKWPCSKLQVLKQFWNSILAGILVMFVISNTFLPNSTRIE